MTRNLLGVSALALIASLSACGSSEEPANNVAAESDMNTTMAGPFAASEMQMSDAIKKAVGINASDSWVRKMIEHHRGAVEMSRIALAQSATGDAAKMAQQTIEKQTAEIADLEKLVATGSPDAVSAQLYQTAETQMHDAMMAAQGADISETYLRKMLAHHQGAIAMSDIALSNGSTGSVRAQIEKTRADQQKEVTMVEAMLRGEPMPAAASAPAPVSATPRPPATVALTKPTSKPAAVAKPTPAPVKPKPTTSAPSVDPHAGHDMNNM